MIEYISLEKQIDKLGETINNEVFEQRKYLIGRVLTVVDSVISDPEQRKATKDILNDIMYANSYWYRIAQVLNDFREANGIVKRENEAIDIKVENSFIKNN